MGLTLQVFSEKPQLLGSGYLSPQEFSLVSDSVQLLELMSAKQQTFLSDWHLKTTELRDAAVESARQSERAQVQSAALQLEAIMDTAAKQAKDQALQAVRAEIRAKFSTHWAAILLACTVGDMVEKNILPDIKSLIVSQPAFANIESYLRGQTPSADIDNLLSLLTARSDVPDASGFIVATNQQFLIEAAVLADRFAYPTPDDASPVT